MRKNKYAIGIDVGATVIKVGLVKANGKIVSKNSFSTKRAIAKNDLIEEIIKQIKQLKQKNSLSNKDLVGVGIGFPGCVDYAKGIVHDLTNIKGWKNVPLKKILQKRLGLLVSVDNDVNAFAQGQLIWGVARKIKNAICITLGSGVGGGLIINGAIYRGSNYSAGEVGHICIDIDGPRCGCGSNGCLEAFVGNTYIIKRCIEKIKKGEKTILVSMVGGKLSKIKPDLMHKAAKKGDRFSINAWKDLGTYLGVGLSGLVNVLNPEKIIIGGGVSKAGKFIFEPLKKELIRRTMKQHLKILKIVKADFADEAGVVGAASLAMKVKR